MSLKRLPKVYTTSDVDAMKKYYSQYEFPAFIPVLAGRHTIVNGAKYKVIYNVQKCRTEIKGKSISELIIDEYVDDMREELARVVGISWSSKKALEELGVTLSQYALSTLSQYDPSEETAKQSRPQPLSTDGSYSSPRQTEEPEQC